MYYCNNLIWENFIDYKIIFSILTIILSEHLNYNISYKQKRINRIETLSGSNFLVPMQKVIFYLFPLRNHWIDLVVGVNSPPKKIIGESFFTDNITWLNLIGSKTLFCWYIALATPTQWHQNLTAVL